MELAARSEFFADPSIARIGLGEPAMPLAVSPAVRFFSIRLAGRLSKTGIPSLRVSPSYRVFLSRTQPARRSRPAALLDFRSLQHLQAPKVVLAAELPIRRRPPSGFGYPLDGFIPLMPGRFCFAPAALLGFALRSFLHSSGTRGVSAERRPAYRFSRQLLPPRKRWAGPAGRGFRVFSRASVPRDRRVMSAPTAGCSPGLAPFKVRQRKPWPGFRPASSSAFADSHDCRRNASESQSAFARPHPRPAQAPGRTRRPS